jgi:hypothetical protein
MPELSHKLTLFHRGVRAVVGHKKASSRGGIDQVGSPEFIGVWLALKVAGQWKNWTESWSIEVDGRTIQVVGREVFNIFLLGNALSVGFAAIGAKLIDWLSACAWPEAFAGGGSALIGATILLLVVRWHSKAREQPNPALERDRSPAGPARGPSA